MTAPKKSSARSTIGKGWISPQELRLHAVARKQTAIERRQAPHPPLFGELDRGIERAVKLLQDGGIRTVESCEGGTGHAFPEPTVVFGGGPEQGWRALAICLENGLPVLELRRVWSIRDRNEPAGPDWEIVFRARIY